MEKPSNCSFNRFKNAQAVENCIYAITQCIVLQKKRLETASAKCANEMWLVCERVNEFVHEQSNKEAGRESSSPPTLKQNEMR